MTFQQSKQRQNLLPPFGLPTDFFFVIPPALLLVHTLIYTNTTGDNHSMGHSMLPFVNPGVFHDHKEERTQSFCSFNNLLNLVLLVQQI